MHTFLDDNILSNEISIDGFNVERRDRTRNGGGVLLYISNMYRYTRRYDYESSDLEIVCIQLHLNHQKDMIVIGVYRPPSSGISCFDKLSDELEVIQ